MTEDKNKLSIKKPVIIFLLVIVGLLLAFWLFAYINDTPAADSCTEPAAVFCLPHRLSETAPFQCSK